MRSPIFDSYTSLVRVFQDVVVWQSYKTSPVFQVLHLLFQQKREMTSVAVYGECLSSYTKHVFQIGEKSFCSLPLYSNSEPYIRIGLIKLSNSLSARLGCNLTSEGVV